MNPSVQGLEIERWTAVVVDTALKSNAIAAHFFVVIIFMKMFVPVLKSFLTIDADGANNFFVSADINGANILTALTPSVYFVDAHITDYC